MVRTFARHWIVTALCLARASEGSRIEISSEIIPITTSNSTSVNALNLLFITCSLPGF